MFHVFESENTDIAEDFLISLNSKYCISENLIYIDEINDEILRFFEENSIFVANKTFYDF